MKKILLLLTLTSGFAFGQSITITKAEYQLLKDVGNIDPTAHYIFSDPTLPTNVQYSMGTEKNGVCDCMVPLDSTFTLAMLPNDDESSPFIALPFTFDFYGQTYDSVVINNNGNISFLAPYSTFTANPFPDAMYNMIAPFWGDVDTRSANGGQVWYKLTPNAMIVIWNEVGYFAYHEDLVSTFQLIISDGSDPLVPTGNNVSFCYEDMQWTTGDASSGVGGFGGMAATVGVNTGDGINYFQVGQYDQTGTTFDGPYGATDGVDFLDGQEVYFNVAGAASSNTPPLMISSAICDTIDVYTGDTLVKSLNSTGFTFAIAGPESNQTINTVITCDAPDALTYTVISVTPEFVVYECEFNATGLSTGFYNVNITATDNGIPVGVTTKSFVVEVIYDDALGMNVLNKNDFKLYPNPTSGNTTIQLGSEVSNATVVVSDFSGKMLMTNEIENTSSFTIGNLAQGAYVVSVYSNGTILGKQILVKE